MTVIREVRTKTIVVDDSLVVITVKADTAKILLSCLTRSGWGNSYYPDMDDLVYDLKAVLVDLSGEAVPNDKS